MSDDNVKIEVPGHTTSLKIDEMTLDQLVMLSQGFGHQIEQLRTKRAYLKAKIDERLALMERTGDENRDEGRKRLQLELARLEIAARAAGRITRAPGEAADGTAPGAVIEAGVS